MKVWPSCLILSGFQASSFTVGHCALGTAPLKTSVSLVLQILPITPHSSCLFYINFLIPCVVCIPGNKLRFSGECVCLKASYQSFISFLHRLGTSQRKHPVLCSYKPGSHRFFCIKCSPEHGLICACK